jgi:hypothetical protein
VSWESVWGFVSDLEKARKNVKTVSRKDKLMQFSKWFLIVSFTPWSRPWDNPVCMNTTQWCFAKTRI